ncbi:MAG: rubrerythrin family protein [Anaerolineaceae bacterium]
MAKTHDDLMDAFAGESQANRKYLAFAKKAEEEGFTQIAHLFRTVAHAETIHALSHFKVAGKVNSTAENLKSAIEGETYEFTTMYPEFIADAEAESEARAIKSFTNAMEVEKVHEALYREALENIGKSSEPYDYYICPVCGYIHPRNAPEKCPVCSTVGTRFEVIP